MPVRQNIRKVYPAAITFIENKITAITKTEANRYKIYDIMKGKIVHIEYN